ncbi:hemin ABC transporter substrate-binding protein [Roseovarius spongiae]|uniref:Hemin ABC transporter substrate-binding protein n=1 Tax=Roseovarius spongiae TaxID=2320272 RepID=A0A3A8B2W5_9RHOB|nr:ABC transporter substrate-binding protein [Roseovarius spongiae]RKF14592.1 hemin ABC transporter substrate-binding protein [Roseovarius spongiae]
MRRILVTLGALVLAASAAAEPAQRIVSIGGAITEIVYQLGQQDRLVARDTTSIYPEAALELPDVGYVRALSPEGVLSMAPDLVLAEADAGPPATLDVLREARTPLALIPDSPTAAGIVEKIDAVGAALGAEAEADALAASVAAQLARAAARAGAVPEAGRKRVLFVLSGQGGRILAAGRNNEAATVIEMAGAINALDGFEGYKPVSDEAIVQAAPDAILMMTRGGEAMIDDATLFALPAIAATPAGENRAVIRMGGQYLLGFGPRTAQAVQDLADALYGKEADDTGAL